MIRSLYIASTGMEAQQLNIDVISNNLANVNTSAYKRSRADFQDLLYQELTSAGSASGTGTLSPTGIMLGTGVKPIAVEKSFMQGDFKNTAGELDIAIEGKGFFQITKPDGSTAYTRDGSFRRSNDGSIVNADGYLLSPAITIPQDAINVDISTDGIVTAITAGSSIPTELGRIDIANFTNPGGLKSVGQNLYEVTAASGDAVIGTPGQSGLGRLSQGFLEASNVNIAEELINMIVAQRAYEINSKAIQTADEMLQMAGTLKR